MDELAFGNGLLRADRKYPDPVADTGMTEVPDSNTHFDLLWELKRREIGTAGPDD